MATSQNPAPKAPGLTESIINEGKKIAQAGQPAAVDQNVVKAQAVAASQPMAAQPEPVANVAPVPVEGNLSVNADDFAEFKRWKESQANPAPAQPKAQPVAQAAPVQSAAPENLEKNFGKNYVHASRNGVEQYFTAVTWRNLGGDQNKVGYKRVLSTPPELANLKK